MIELLTQTEFTWAANHTIIEFLAGYVFGAALIIGAPGVFFFIAFMSALQRTKGAQIGYSDHKTYGNSSIYENSRTDQTKFYLQISK
jgi:hypothetical protein|tara:strand:+ start:587 stop:847 length:261 start_codon:yes stop_codon:yes gene_type:complete